MDRAPALYLVSSSGVTDGKVQVTRAILTFDCPTDTERPVAEKTAPAETQFEAGRTITIHATDDTSLQKVVANVYANAACTLPVYKSNVTSGLEGQTVYDLTFSTAGYPVGEYCVKYNALDEAGNMSVTKSWTFTVVKYVTPALPTLDPDPTTSATMVLPEFPVGVLGYSSDGGTTLLTGAVTLSAANPTVQIEPVLEQYHLLAEDAAGEWPLTLTFALPTNCPTASASSSASATPSASDTPTATASATPDPTDTAAETTSPATSSPSSPAVSDPPATSDPGDSSAPPTAGPSDPTGDSTAGEPTGAQTQDPPAEETPTSSDTSTAGVPTDLVASETDPTPGGVDSGMTVVPTRIDGVAPADAAIDPVPTTLPVTGTNLLPLLFVATGLLLMGAATVLFRRRSRKASV